MPCICGEAPQGRAAVDPHPVTAEWDGAHIVFVAKLSRRRVGGAVDPYFITVERDESRIVFVAKLSRRRWQSTCPSSSLRIEMCLGELRPVLDYS